MPYARKDIQQMEGYTPGFQPREPGFVKLNTNENPYPPPPEAIEAMQRACAEEIRKYPDPLAEPFRRRAAEVLGLSPDNIICGFGSDDILTIVVRTFCGKGQRIAFPRPTYSLYEVLTRIQGARPVTLEFPDDYSLPPDLAHTESELTFLANPNAPSGTAVPPREVGCLAEELDGVLVVDEAYVDFAEQDCLGLVERCENVIVTRSLSKSYGLAGLRFGYAVARPELVEQMMKVKDSYNVSAPGVAGATAAIARQDWLAETVGRIRQSRRHLSEGLQKLDFHCWPSRTNFVLARAPRGRDALAIFNELMKRKILVRYFDLPRLRDCLRITVGTDRQIETLLEAMEQIMA